MVSQKSAIHREGLQSKLLLHNINEMESYGRLSLQPDKRSMPTEPSANSSTAVVRVITLTRLMYTVNREDNGNTNGLLRVDSLLPQSDNSQSCE